MLKKILVCVFAFLLSASLFACESNEIPLTVDSVETHRVDDSLVRIIIYDTEHDPKIEIELLSTPKIALKKKLVINKVTLGKKTLDFNDSAAVSIDDLKLKDGVVKFSVDFFYRVGSGEVIMDCSVNVAGNNISKLVCEEK